MINIKEFQYSFYFPLPAKHAIKPCNQRLRNRNLVARINTVAFYSVEVENVDMQAHAGNGLPAFTVIEPINPDRKTRQ